MSRKRATTAQPNFLEAQLLELGEETVSERMSRINGLRKTRSGGAGGPRPGAGRPPSPDRCTCGLMTRARAIKRRHQC